MGFNTQPTGRVAEFPHLRPLDTETARAAQRKSVESRMLNKELRETFKRNAVAFQAVLDDIPDFSPLDVIRMCIHLALQDNDYVEASRLSAQLAEYKAPKLARVEAKKDADLKDISDEELEALLAQEGLK